MDSVVIDAGTLTFSEEDMTATGLLIPFGVPCRSNLGMFTFAAGDVTIPEDFTGMSLNIEHKRESVAGGITRAWEQPEGVFATFSYAKTPAGRQAFADGKSGKRKHLSAEVADVFIRDGKALPGATLFAAAQVERPAFEGATLLAAEDTPDDEAPASTDTRYVTEYTDAEGAKWRRVEETHAETVETETGTETTVTTTVTETTDAAAAEEDTTTDTEENTLTATATAPRPTVTIPSTFLGSAPKSKTADVAPEDVALGVIFASIDAIRKDDPDRANDAATLLAALADIKVGTPDGLATADSGVLQPAWVGKLWQGKRYQRKYIDLFTHLYGGIQLGGRSGYTMTADDELVKEWTGNKTELPTGGATTDTKSSKLRRFGWAADIAREWFDLEGGADVLEELFKLVVDSYARVTDRASLVDVFNAASRADTALDRLIAPESLPAGTPAGLAYYPAVVQLIQAIEAVSDADDEPTFAVVNPIAWKQLIYTPKDLLPEYISLQVRAGTGEGNVDGKVVVKKAPQSYFPGLTTTEPATLAGAKGAIEFRELGQTPIQLDALDIARGGVDRATVGYLESFVVRAESLALIGKKSA